MIDKAKTAAAVMVIVLFIAVMLIAFGIGFVGVARVILEAW